jgi:hypothetical protein
MNSFPGAGSALAPRLIAALGSQRERYRTAQEIQITRWGAPGASNGASVWDAGDAKHQGAECYSGIAPVVASSGQQRWVHWRWACPRFLRQTFHEWALHSIAYCPWAREYYEQQRTKGKRHNTAVRALAFKWIRILFRCWKERKPYDEAIYLRALGARRPKTPLAAPVVELQWKDIAGFLKIAIKEA